ncbi:putative DNA-binding transcriptional regulator [compost metagenome]
MVTNMYMNNEGFKEAIKTIGDAIISSEYSFLTHRKKNQRLDLKDNNQICYLVDGSVSIYRVEDGILKFTVDTPAILGLAQMRIPTKTHFMRSDTNCDFWLIDAERATELLNSKNLWCEAYEIISHHLSLYIHREKMQSKPSVKELVLEHIKYLWKLEEDVRSRTSIYSFILSRNAVSRSAVHKALNELIADGLIEVYRGILNNYHCQR